MNKIFALIIGLIFIVVAISGCIDGNADDDYTNQTDVDPNNPYDDFVLIQANMFGLIRFSSTLTGYLLNLKKKNNEDKAIITIIEKYS